MAEDQDDSQKSEEPTQKRLDDARDKGQVSNSREVNNFMIMATATLLLATFAPYGMQRLARVLEVYLAQAAVMPLDGPSLGTELITLLGQVGIVMAAPFAAFVVAAIASSAMQNGIVWTSQPLHPKFDKISPMAGLKRLFSTKSIVEFVKNVVKMTLIGALGLAVIWPDRMRLMVTGRLETGVAMGYLDGIVLSLLMAMSAAMAILAGLDFTYQRFEFMKQMRMSRRDIQDEHKQSEGDPVIKQRLRALRMQRARQRMMAEVPDSTVVVTNPTHVSVALRYERERDAAPVVIAKGVELVALKIREVAKEHGVPIVESPPLARALYKQVELGQMIPPDHFQAVAEIIGYVLRLRASRS
ncbi:MAG: flagellar biosynthesis protein FlhB [Geminicoccaceae bacterium]|nr:flagellar biosynthesis protein FlhB [Geminicoccaceae bacterium]MCB9942358.1 flagellar biosynthesis protein FlhB [Geminicoccaceae bacterium]